MDAIQSLGLGFSVALQPAVLWYAFLVVLIAGIATMLYQPLGFILTMSLLVFTLLMVVERKNVLRAAAYSVGLTMVAWWVFGTALKSPLETGILGF